MMRLFRPRLALLNGIAAIGGYLLLPGLNSAAMLGAICAGVTLLAAAGSALNQVMERDLDPLMRRTCDRPLPTGRISPVAASGIGVACALAGAALLFACGGMSPALIGIGALFWYLAVYTPLKRRTSFALLVGALCGAAPPVIGWTAAGGSATDFRIILLAGVLYLWQVPHFWLLQRRHADDYRRAGFPLFAPSGNDRQMLFCLVWMVAMFAAAMMLPALGMVGGNPVAWCVAFCVPIVVAAIMASESALFTCVNLFPLFVTVAVCAGR